MAFTVACWSSSSPIVGASHASGASANTAQSVFAGIDSFSFTTIAIHISSSKELFLHLGKQVSRNNRLLASGNVVLWNRAIILNSRFFNKVCGDCFLQKSIAYVLLILKNTLNCTKVPFVFFSAGLYLISLKTSSNFTKASPFKKFSVDAFYYLCFLLVYDEISFFILGLA